MGSWYNHIIFIINQAKWLWRALFLLVLFVLPVYAQPDDFSIVLEKVMSRPSEKDKKEVWTVIDDFLKKTFTNRPDMADFHYYFVVSEVMISDSGEFLVDVKLLEDRYLLVIVNSKIVAATKILNERETQCKPGGIPEGLVHP